MVTSNSSLPMVETKMGHTFPSEEQLQTYSQMTYQSQNQHHQNQTLPPLQHQLMQQTFTPYQTPLYQYPVLQESSENMALYSTTKHHTLKHNTTAPKIPLFQTFDRHPVDFLTVHHSQQQPQQHLHQENRQQHTSPISPLSSNQSGLPMFQLPGQSSSKLTFEKLEPSNSTVTKAIQAAEAFVAKEVGHVPRNRKAGVINPKTEASYICHICAKVFNRPYNLKSHQKTHSTEKPFPCKFCSKSFARSHDRKRHEKLHEGEKKFKCGGILKDGITRWGCNRRFARADALGRHFRTETGWSCIRPLMIEAKDQEINEALVSNSSEAFGNTQINRLVSE